MGFVEGLLDVGEVALQGVDTWLTPCPAGSRVDGYQVNQGRAHLPNQAALFL